MRPADARRRRRVLVVDPIDPGAERRLGEAYSLIRPEGLAPLQLRAAIRDAVGVVVRTTPLSSEVLKPATNLRVIAKHGSGVDNIDVDYATARGVVVARAGAANAPAVAEFALTAILLSCKPILAGARWLRSGPVQGSLVVAAERAGLVGRELSSQIVGVIGWGAIGSRVGSAVRALGGNVLVFDPPAQAGQTGTDVRFVSSLDQLLRHADIVTVHVPLTASTRSLIGASELAVMQRDAVLVNTSRGGVVDEDALVRAVADGRLRFATVDVLEREPPDRDDPLLWSDRLICTPHIAGSTREALQRMGHAAASAVLDVLAGVVPTDVANREVLARLALRTRSPNDLPVSRA